MGSPYFGKLPLQCRAKRLGQETGGPRHSQIPLRNPSETKSGDSKWTGL